MIIYCKCYYRLNTIIIVTSFFGYTPTKIHDTNVVNNYYFSIFSTLQTTRHTTHLFLTNSNRLSLTICDGYTKMELLLSSYYLRYFSRKVSVKPTNGSYGIISFRIHQVDFSKTINYDFVFFKN